MILTGDEISREHTTGRIVISPFDPQQLNPNSYNFRLGRRLSTYTARVLDPRHPNDFSELEIPDSGLVLEPLRLYLAHTEEVLGSEFYVPTFSARSSVARLGLFINLSASLGDIGFIGQWTLQLFAVNAIKIYPGMCIGQMMWWRPKGKIILYSGKYQGSAGPRPSEIHVDLRSHLARGRLPSLSAGISTEDGGAKFAKLSALSTHFPVPPAFSVGTAEYAAALTESQRDSIRRSFADMQGTVGVYAAESCNDIASIASEVQVPPELREFIHERLANFGEASGTTYAVRSSASDEDGDSVSLAGVYKSYLDVASDEVVEAIEACWRSYYSMPAILARVRAGDFSTTPRMGVIVQSMVASAWAGVAFTDSQRVTIEYKSGMGDTLMAGSASPQVASIGSDDKQALSGFLYEVRDLALRVRDMLGHEVDIEWAVDSEQLWLLQCRAVTASLSQQHRSALPIARAVPLYQASEARERDGFELGAVEGIVGSFRRKRQPAYDLARHRGAAVPTGWVVNLNALGIRDLEAIDRLHAILAAGPSAQVVVDLGDGLRQLIIPKIELIERLQAMLFDGRDDTVVQALVVREFIPGNFGVISTANNARLILETSPDGLMAMNRGSARASHWNFEIETGQRAESSAWLNGQGMSMLSTAQLLTIYEVTSDLNSQYGTVAAEWVVTDDTLCFVDYSIVGRTIQPTERSGSIVMSAGDAAGPIFCITMPDAELQRLSDGAAVSVSHSVDRDELDWARKLVNQVADLPTSPIVVAHRPYAALSVLIDHVAGFIFSDGAILCHLAIILRESRIPAVIVSEPPTSGYAVLAERTVSFYDQPPEL